MTTTDDQRPQLGAQARERLETVRDLHPIVGERIAKLTALDEVLRTATELSKQKELDEVAARKALNDASEDAARRSRLISLKLETAQLEGQIPLDAYRAALAAAFPVGAAAVGVLAGERHASMQRIAKALEETPTADPSGTLRQSALNGAKALEDANNATKTEAVDKATALQALSEARARWDEGYTATKEILSGLLRDVGRRAELGGLFSEVAPAAAPAKR